MGNYEETVRENLDGFSDLELQQRLRSGMLTEEARAVVADILNARGAPLETPIDSVADRVHDQVELSIPGRPEPRSVFLGFGILLTIFGLAVLINSGQSPMFGVGVAISQLLISSTISMPIFLVWRFFTSHGRAKQLSTAFNVFSAMVLVVWLFLFVLALNLLKVWVPRVS